MSRDKREFNPIGRQSREGELHLPHEIEAKIVVADINEFKQRILDSGGVLEREGAFLSDTYYGLGEKRADFRGFLSTPLRVDSVSDLGRLDQALSYLGMRIKERMSDRKGDFYLIERPSRINPRHIRIRENQAGEKTFTVKAKREKGGVGRIDQRVEIEIPISDDQEIISFLEAIGYRKGRTEIKERTTYQLGEALIEINILPQQGDVVYAEVEAPTKEALFAAAGQLGVQPDQLISMSTKDFLAYLGHQESRPSKQLP